MNYSKDYGGYGNRKHALRRNYGDSSGSVSMRCRDCAKLRYIAPIELTRAAMPRCFSCGGPLEEVDISRKRRGLPKKVKAARQAIRAVTPRCKACGQRINDFLCSKEQSLSVHLQGRSDCLRYYVGERLLSEIGGFLFIAGTERIEKQNLTYFQLVGLTQDGNEKVGIKNSTKKHLEWILSGMPDCEDQCEHREAIEGQ